MTLQDNHRNDPWAMSPRIPPRPTQGNGLAIASLVLGITSIVFCWWGLFTLVQIVLAVIFGGVAIGTANQGAGRKGMAVAGLACGIAGFIAYVLFGISTLGIGFVI
jgi:hypothetical protein